MAEMRRVSVIGLGLMGAAVARSLLAAGHQVTVWNRTHSKAQALGSEGAIATPDLATAVAASPLSIWCLLDYQMMAELMREGATKEALAGRTVVPSATGGPDDVALVAELLEPIGATLLDAKIMFFPSDAGHEDAELLLSGSGTAFDAHDSTLRDIAGVCRYLGSDPAAASVLYTALWSYDFAARFAYMEGAALVEASGLSLEDFERSAALRTAQFPTQNAELSDRFGRGDFDGDQATVEIYAEGMAPMLGAFRTAGVAPHLLEAVGKHAEDARHAGHGGKDVSVIFDLLRRRAEQTPHDTTQPKE
jgi:3-hydroxyisobutyrate dehydrogenase-like beta-hydroxyacid dehydrogenase